MRVIDKINEKSVFKSGNNVVHFNNSQFKGYITIYSFIVQLCYLNIMCMSVGVLVCV